MKLSFFRRIRLDHLVTVFAVMGVCAIAVGRAPKDALITAVEKMEASYTTNFTQKNDWESTLAGKTVREEVLVPLREARVATHVAGMAELKKRIEKESIKRAIYPLGDKRLNNVTVAAQRYFDLQSKLYLNLLRNAHADGALPKNFDPKTYDSLNLVVDAKTAMPFLTNPEFGKMFSIRHARDERGGHSKVEVFLNTEEKRMAEYFLLLDPRTKFDYMKLVQFATLRESIVNRWAIRRMSLTQRMTADAVIPACAPELLSFRLDRPQRMIESPQYDELWSADRYGDLMNLRRGIVELSRNRSLLSSGTYADLTSRFIMGFEQFQNEVLPFYAERLPELEANFKKHFGPSIERIEEESWYSQKKDLTGQDILTVADQAFMDYNFPADDLSAEKVAERFTWIAFEMRKKFISDALIVFAEDQQMKEARSPVQMRRAYQLVSKAVAPYEKKWKEAMHRAVVDHLNAKQTLSYLNERNQARFYELEKQILPAATLGAKAVQMIELVDQKKKELYRTPMNPNDPASPYVYSGSHISRTSLRLAKVGFRLRPFTADHVSQFFYKKLEHYAADKNNHLPERKIAVKILESRVVMSHMSEFFALLSENFTKELGKKNLTQATETNSPLESVLVPTAQKIFVQLTAAISQPPVVVTPPAPPRDERRRFETPRAVADATRVARTIIPSLQEQKTFYIADPKKRHETMLLFGEALSILGLGQAGAGLQPSLDTQNYARIPVWQIQSHVAIEWLLNRQQPGLPLIDRVAASLLDQKILGQVLETEVYAKAPLLAIQAKNEDDAPSTLKTLSTLYSPATGWKRNEYVSGLMRATATALANDRGKLEDYCQANLRDHKNDEKFRKLYQASSGLREIFARTPQVKKWDEELQKDTRTRWQKILQDYIDPISMVAFAAILCIVLWQVAPLIFGMFGATAAGATTVATGATGIFSSFGTFLTFVFTANYGPAGLMFLAQTVMMINVYLIQLPPQLKYQLSVANSQIGMFSQPIASRAKIKEFRDELSSMQTWTYVAIGGEVVGQIVAARGAMKTLGLVGKNKIARLSAGLSPEIVESLRAKTLRELIDEHGTSKGLKIYADRYLEAARRYQRIGALRPTAEAAALQALFAKNVASRLPEKELIDVIYRQKIAELTRKMSALERQSTDLARYVADPNRYAFPEKVGVWLRNLRLKLAPKSLLAPNWRFTQEGKHWKILVAKNLEDAVLNGQLHPSTHSVEEIRAFIMHSMAKEIGFDLDYFQGLRKKLAEATSAPGEEATLRFLSSLSSEDIARHQSLFSWLRRYPFDSRYLEVRNALADLKFLNEDLSRMRPRVEALHNFESLQEIEALVKEDGETDLISAEDVKKLPEGQYEIYTVDPKDVQAPNATDGSRISPDELGPSLPEEIEEADPRLYGT